MNEAVGGGVSEAELFTWTGHNHCCFNCFWIYDATVQSFSQGGATVRYSGDGP